MRKVSEKTISLSWVIKDIEALSEAFYSETLLLFWGILNFKDTFCGLKSENSSVLERYTVCKLLVKKRDYAR